MEEYSIEIVDNHIIVVINGIRVLIDTGSPSSLSDGSVLTLLGNNYNNFTDNLQGFTIDDLNNFINARVNILLGEDVLRNINFFVDWDNRRILFSIEPFQQQGTFIPLNFFMGIPIVELEINNERFNVFLDSGAKVSYLNQELTDNYEQIGEAEDFYPGFGNFTTNIYKVPVRLGNTEIIIRAGNLPNILQYTLHMANCRGILGNEINNYFNVYFNLSIDQLILIPKNL